MDQHRHTLTAHRFPSCLVLNTPGSGGDVHVVCTVSHISTLRRRLCSAAIAPEQERAFHERCLGPSRAGGGGDDRENLGMVVPARQSSESWIRQRALAGRTTPVTVPGTQVAKF